jgi:hypothetical protein
MAGKSSKSLQQRSSPLCVVAPVTSRFFLVMKGMIFGEI